MVRRRVRQRELLARWRLRRYWPRYFDMKSTFLSAVNLAQLFKEANYRLVRQSPVASNVSAGYVLDRVGVTSVPKLIGGALLLLHDTVPTGSKKLCFGATK